ncbi:hypothetical protein R3P38DRAFT_2796715 [Favolaschia claudopus]|uniref:Uncharacterized protein n=1 Tax=Favolaschia claudopus TaxID=2862362 RepID=A0AAW0A5S3_9AGAR
MRLAPRLDLGHGNHGKDLGQRSDQTFGRLVVRSSKFIQTIGAGAFMIHPETSPLFLSFSPLFPLFLSIFLRSLNRHGTWAENPTGFVPLRPDNANDEIFSEVAEGDIAPGEHFTSPTVVSEMSNLSLTLHLETAPQDITFTAADWLAEYSPSNRCSSSGSPRTLAATAIRDVASGAANSQTGTSSLSQDMIRRNHTARSGIAKLGFPDNQFSVKFETAPIWLGKWMVPGIHTVANAETSARVLTKQLRAFAKHLHFMAIMSEKFCGEIRKESMIWPDNSLIRLLSGQIRPNHGLFSDRPSRISPTKYTDEWRSLIYWLLFDTEY